MKLNHIHAIILRQYYLMRGSVARLIPLFAWVAIDIVLWGFITRYLNGIASSPFNFLPLFLGAVLLWDFLTRVMQGVTMAFFEDVWARNFLTLFAAPLSVGEYVSGLVISSILTSSIGLVVMIAIAGFAFGLSFLGYGLIIIPFLLVLFLFGIALGIVGCAIVLRFGPAAEWFIWPIPAFISPFACVFYPLATLPRWMQAISRLLPPSYVFEGMRTIVAGHPVSSETLVISFMLSAGYILLACRLFTHVYRHAVQTGLLARYSAESVS